MHHFVTDGMMINSLKQENIFTESIFHSLNQSESIDLFLSTHEQKISNRPKFVYGVYAVRANYLRTITRLIILF